MLDLKLKELIEDFFMLGSALHVQQLDGFCARGCWCAYVFYSSDAHRGYVYMNLAHLCML